MNELDIEDTLVKCECCDKVITRSIDLDFLKNYNHCFSCIDKQKTQTIKWNKNLEW